MGTPTSVIINEHAGGIRNGNKLKAFIPGGSSVPMLPADKVDVPYDYESIAEAGSMLGSGALIVMDDTTNVVAETLRLAYFTCTSLVASARPVEKERGGCTNC